MRFVQVVVFKMAEQGTHDLRQLPPLPSKAELWAYSRAGTD
jgi:hypothetical protein